MKFFEMDNDTASKSVSSRSLTIAVFGQGKMGLPISVVFLQAGYNVIGVDIEAVLVNNLNKGIVPIIREPGVYEGIKNGLQKNKYRATLSVEEALQNSDIIVIIIPIIVDEDKIPNLKPLRNLMEKIGSNLKRGHLLIQETTLPIGTTEGIIKSILENQSGLSAGKDFGLGFSPERTYSGRVIEDITKNYPKIVGGINEKSTKRMSIFYESFVEKGVIKMTSATTAEAVKVYKGVFRDINIAIANELAKISEILGVDFYEVRKAVNSEPSGNILMPGAGVGGHCIPVYPHFLIESAREKGYDSKLIKTGREINLSMAQHVIDRSKNSLKQIGKSIESAKICLLGLAYRGNVKEHRYSPTVDIIKLFNQINAHVYLHDPLYTKEDIESIIEVNFEPNLELAVKDADIVILLSDHKDYDYSLVELMDKTAGKPYIFLDTRNIFDVEENEVRKIEKIGI